MENILVFLQEEPSFSFAILLLVILVIPLLFEKLKLPGLLGLLVAGVCLGENGLKLLDSESQMMVFLSDLGLLCLMFVAGLEIDMEQFHKIKQRSGVFGTFTFSIPLITGTIVGRIFNFDWNSSILIGSLLASHSLMTYPIIRRLGVVSNEAVTVTLGGTIFTDIGALIVLAICIGVGSGNFTFVKLLSLLGLLTVYTLIVLFGFDWAGREFLRRSGADEGNKFLFLLLALFLAAIGAEAIGVEKIVGAFLAGLAVNDAVGDSSVKEKVIFVGSVLFTPIFFVDIGLILDVPAFLQSLSSIGFSLIIIGSLIGSKFAAAYLTQLIYHYQRREMLTMWSMSIPQVATTLAATLVGHRAGLLTDEVLNAVVVMMVVTATLGPLMVSRVAVGLPLAETDRPDDLAPVPSPESPSRDRTFTVVVPVYNPHTERALIEMAALLARRQQGRIVPLAITVPPASADSQQLERALGRSEALLETAMSLSRELDVRAEPMLRIDDRVAQGISRASQERRANLIVMGWGNRTGLRAKLFGNTIDSVFWTAHCPVAVARLLAPASRLQRILVPIENFSPPVARKVYFAQMLADANGGEIVLFYVWNGRLAADRKTWIKTQLHELLSPSIPASKIKTRIGLNDDMAAAILEKSQQFDLVVLYEERHLATDRSLTPSNLTDRLVRQLTCSVIVLGEPKPSL